MLSRACVEQAVDGDICRDMPSYMHNPTHRWASTLLFSLHWDVFRISITRVLDQRFVRLTSHCGQQSRVSASPWTNINHPGGFLTRSVRRLTTLEVGIEGFRQLPTYLPRILKVQVSSSIPAGFYTGVGRNKQKDGPPDCRVNTWFRGLVLDDLDDAGVDETVTRERHM